MPLLPRLVVGRDHIVAVDLEDFLGGAGDRGGRRREFLHIECAARRIVGREGEEFGGGGEIFRVQLLHRAFQAALAGQRDIVRLDIRVGLEGRVVLLEERLPFLLLAAEHEEQPRVHALGRDLHVLRRDDAVVILAQDDVDGAAQVLKQHDGIDADREQYQQHGRNAQQESAVQSHHRIFL